VSSQQLFVKELKMDMIVEESPQTQTESTTEPIRKLASIRRIAAIDPIEGADRIVCATVDGWKLVTQKSNNFQPGDLVVYFEIDSFLPVEERFEFLRSSSFKSTKHLGDGFRIKTIKLKGQVSQGLILPLPEFGLKEGDDVFFGENQEGRFIVEEGSDLTEYLGVKKYEKPLSPQLVGVARGNFPSFIRKTDQERVQNIFGKLKGHKSTYDPDTGVVVYTEEYNYDQLERWEATLKLDGSSMTVYLAGMDTEEGARFGVCSRNLDLKETEDNTFWQVARKLNLEEKLLACGRNIALQGELMGPGVQNNREELKEHDFYLFDIWDIDAQRYLTPAERLIICAEFFNDLSHAPMVGSVSLADFNSVDDFLKYADRPSLNHKIAEGVVFKRFDTNSSFKVINNKFLLAEKD
jgi:RNA ligase (TIGR02306 family)